VPGISGALADPDPVVRAAALAALGRIGDPAACGAVLGALKDPDMTVRIGAATVLGQLRCRSAAGPLADLQKNDPFTDVREAAGRALARIPGRT